jgi:hypothetical protein
VVCLVIALALAAGVRPAAGATVVWTGPNLGAWTENDYWNTGVAPTADDDVILNTAGITVDVNTAIQVKSVTLLAGSVRILTYVSLCSAAAALRASSRIKIQKNQIRASRPS